MTNMRERIARALEAKVKDMEENDPTFDCYRRIGRPEYEALADAVIKTYYEVAWAALTKLDPD